MFFIKKKSEEELAKLPLDKNGRKEGRSLVKGVNKFLRYNDDLLADEKRASIVEKRDAFAASLQDRTKTRKEMEELAEDLSEYCKKSVKDFKASVWKENLEVIFVAVVIAMGIRAYFIQQFKIPTGSMQPTLNGIVAYPTPEINPGSEYQAPTDYEKPGFAKRAWDKFWFGRSHIEWVIDEDDSIVFDGRHFYEKTLFFFFPRTYLITRNGEKFSAPGTASRIADLLAQPLRESQSRLLAVKEGDVIARGFVDTGDQLVVNKFIYHWIPPKRGDVFVFHTRDIAKIQRELPDPRQGSQHYIKRIAGVPGDELEIRPPSLLVNGAPAAEPGIQRVVRGEGYYNGYTTNGGRNQVSLKEEEYWALGDNSDNSSDSRNWGTVPERNIVGRGAFVYYPFGHHFGKID